MDVMDERNNQRLTTTLFQKPTHTDRYLNFRSYHHPRVKTSIIKCLVHRARAVCNEEEVEKEIRHLQHVFRVE